MVKKYFKLFLLFILLGLFLAFAKRTSIIFVLIITSIYFVITLIDHVLKRSTITIPEKNRYNAKYISYLLSFILFITCFFINKDALSLKSNLYESLSLFIVNLLITYPINPKHYTNIDDTYNISSTNRIISETIPTEEEIETLNKMGIRIIIFNKKNLPKKLSSYFKEASISDIKKNKNHNLYLQEPIREINKYLNGSTIYTNDFYYTINNVKDSRGIVDNLILTIKINDIASYSLSLILLVTLLYGFPQIFNNYLLLLIVLVFKFLNTYFLPNIAYDYDIYNRRPRPLEDKIFTKQEIMFNIFEIIAILICISTIFMATLSSGATVFSAASICLNIYFYCLLFIILIHYSESLTIINVFKIFKNIFAIIMLLLLIVLTIVIYKVPLINIQSIGWNNYYSSIILAIICTIWFDITKIARYLKNRKKEEYVKNN